MSPLSQINTDKANALNSFFHIIYRCLINYDFPPLTEFPEALEPNLPADNCPKQLLSTEESVYDLLVANMVLWKLAQQYLYTLISM